VQIEVEKRASISAYNNAQRDKDIAKMEVERRRCLLEVEKEEFAFQELKRKRAHSEGQTIDSDEEEYITVRGVADKHRDELFKDIPPSDHDDIIKKAEEYCPRTYKKSKQDRTRRIQPARR
jgi:hypothetical protein